jgi:hypothetical protein
MQVVQPGQVARIYGTGASLFRLGRGLVVMTSRQAQLGFGMAGLQTPL